MNPAPALAILALAANPFAANAQAPQLSLEHRMQLRCSAAFAMVSFGQENERAEFMAYPELGQRAREYFVRASASVMDQAGLDREAISAALSAEAQDILDKGALAQVMQVCLPLLPPE